MLTRIPDWKLDNANHINLNAVHASNQTCIVEIDAAFVGIDAHVTALTTLDGLASGATAGQITALLAAAAAVYTDVSEASIAAAATKETITAARAPIAVVF